MKKHSKKNETSLSHLESLNKSLQNDKESLTTKLSLIENQLLNAQSSNTNLQHIKASLESELITLKQTMQANQEESIPLKEHKQLQTKLLSKTNLITQLQTQNEQLTNLITTHENTIHLKETKINIDGIIDSSYIKKYLDTNKLFPTIIQTERPDKASIALLEGKCIILVENSPYALILPSFFLDFFHTPDDYYQKNINTTFIRLIRLSAFLISLLTPAIYIATTTRNYNLLPYKLLIMLKAGRTFVPFPAYIEAIFMIICFEILKETDIRMSQTSSSAVSILGGLILGDAAVSAGIVSPIMIIVIAISSISGLIFSSLELSNALRSYKIILLILSSLLGIYGVLIGLIYLIINLINTKTFNYKYLSPIYPFNKNEIKDSFIKLKNNKRNSYLTNNINRGD